MRAQIGHCDSSLSSYWRDDAPQTVSTAEHDFLPQCSVFLASSCATCSKASSILSNVQFRVFYFSPENAFVFFPVNVITMLYLLQVFMAVNSSCHWPFIPACFSSSARYRNRLAHALSWRKYSHIPRTYGSFPIIVQILPRYAFFSTTCLHCPFVSGFFSFCLHSIVEALLEQVGRVRFLTLINHHRRQLPVAE